MTAGAFEFYTLNHVVMSEINRKVPNDSLCHTLVPQSVKNQIQHQGDFPSPIKLFWIQIVLHD